MATIKYKGKKKKVSDEDYESIKRAFAVNGDRVDIQVKKGDKYDIEWLDLQDIVL